MVRIRTLDPAPNHPTDPPQDGNRRSRLAQYPSQPIFLKNSPTFIPLAVDTSTIEPDASAIANALKPLDVLVCIDDNQNHCLVCFILASSRQWNRYAILVECREESSTLPEALTSEDRLLPPARAQGFGTSCGLTAHHKDSLARESRRRLTLPTTLVSCSVTRSFQTGAHPCLAPRLSTASVSVSTPPVTDIA